MVRLMILSYLKVIYWQQINTFLTNGIIAEGNHQPNESS